MRNAASISDLNLIHQIYVKTCREILQITASKSVSYKERYSNDCQLFFFMFFSLPGFHSMAVKAMLLEPDPTSGTC